MNRFFNLILLIIFCGALTACPSKHKSENPRSITVIMGDPMQIVAGTQMTQEIPADYFDGAEIYKLQSLLNFNQKEDYSPLKDRDLEEENKPESAEELMTDDRDSFSVIRSGNGLISLESKKLNIKINFTLNKNKNYEARTLVSGSKTTKINLLHFSTTTDRRFFSILISGDSKDDKSLVALYFSRDVYLIQPQKIDSRFNFSKGPGVMFRWNKNEKVSLDICGHSAEEFSYEIRLSFDLWAKTLKDKLTLEVQSSSTVAPFTDLNQKCILVVDGYLDEPDPTVGGYGFALKISDYQKHNFVDGDILIFKNEFAKRGAPMNSSENANRLSFTITHELGHFFGLAHQFDKGTTSIMGYNFNIVPKLYPYDIDAIRALYAN